MALADAWQDGRISRIYHQLLASLVAAALIVQLVIVLRNGLLPRPTRVIRFFSFFTVQSNILVMAGAAMLATNPFRDGRWWRVLRLDGLIGIAVTGVIYTSVLAGLQDLTGWDRAADIALHYVSPIAAVLGWLAFGPRPRIDATTIKLALIWPAAWLGYTLGHGAATSWYPYPFVNVDEHGYARVLVNCAVVTIVLGVLAGAAWLVDQRAPATDASAPAATAPVSTTD
jgi:hypothetical protein